MKSQNSHPYRVLLADDQADIREALRLLLKQEGFESHSAASPADALAAIESREFDAILMDLNYARDTTSGEEGLVLTILRTQIALRLALRRASRLEAENRLLGAESRPNLIAEAPAMQPVLELITRIGPSDANVLITGEHGTGKEVVAQTLHALSSRASKPLVTVNVG